MKLQIFLLFASIAGVWTIDGKIKNFIWPQDSKDLPNLNSRRDVSFYYSYFENFSKSIGEEFKNLKKLKFFDGTVLQVYLKNTFVELDIFNSKTKNLEIDPDEEHVIIKLEVSHCGLSSIPKNINRLRHLQVLKLPYNKIENVRMSDFNGLNKLEELWLYQNEMKKLSTEATIHIPKLRLLHLANNNLQEINVCSWVMPTLEKLSMHSNKLKYVVNLLDQFPKLNSITISKNPLVCLWMDDLVKSLKSKKISDKLDTTCSATDKTHIPIECPLVYSLSTQLSVLLERQRASEQSLGDSTKKVELLEQMVKKSHHDNQALKQTVAILGDQLSKLRHSIENLTEGFYQHAQEMKGGET